MKKILLISTGGTISSQRQNYGLTPIMSGDELLSFIPTIKDICQVDCITPFCIDSTNVMAKNWLEIKDIVKINYNQYDGFVICHGTDTLAYTASALSYLIQCSNKPIVITGSQRPINLEITDAKTNLMDSIIFSCDERAHGVNIVFNGNVIAGTRAKKQRTRSYNAFSSINFPDIAVIRSGKIIFFIDDKQCTNKVRFYDEICDKILLIKLIPGICAKTFQNILPQYKGVIIESFGLGGVPNYDNTGEFHMMLKEYINDGGIVLIATQVLNEGSDMEVYEVGNKIKNELDVLESYDMTIEAATAKLMWILGNKKGFQKIERCFYEQINHDIFMQ